MKKLDIPQGFLFDKVEGNEIILKQDDSYYTNITSVEKAIEVLGDDPEVNLLKWLYNNYRYKDTHLSAYHQLVVVFKAINNGWIPDYRNKKELKYELRFEMSGSSGFRFDGCDFWVTSSDVGSRLVTNSIDKANHIAKHFTPLFKQWMMIKPKEDDTDKSN